jgi:hypothetical protein
MIIETIIIIIIIIYQQGGITYLAMNLTLVLTEYKSNTYKTLM